MAYEKNPDGSYADLEYTKFPAEIDSWQNSEDVTAEYLSLANDYKSALLAGNYGNAQNILNANPQLKRMIFKADDINKLKHSIMAVERFFTEDVDAYLRVYSDKASEAAENAITAANNAALSENSSKEIQKDLGSRYDNIQATLDTANQLSTEAKDSAKRAEASVKYVQQYVGGYYNSYTFEISPENQGTSSFESFKYQYVASCDAATEDRIPMASVYPENMDVATAAGVCRTCLTGDKTITFYSKEIPANTIKIQVTLFSKTA